MIRNFFTTAFRNLTRNKNYAFITVSGLAVGIAVCLIIFLIVRFETSFDTFHSKKEQIYRVVTKFNDPAGVFYSSGVPVPLPAALRQDYPQLPAVAAIVGDNNTQIQVLDEGEQIVKKFREEQGVFFTEPSFFRIFDFAWLAGDPATALREPNTAVLTKETAERYYGSWQSAMGKTIKRNDQRVLTITGVLDNPPANTDFQFKVVVSYPTMNNYGSDDWGTVSSNHMCYFLLPPGLSPKELDRQLVQFAKKYKPADRAHEGQVVQPLSQVHHDRETGNFLQRTVSREWISIVKLIGLFILLIACVNFINLSTALSVTRSKEVGIRKVLGSNRLQLGLQFLSEAALITLGAVLVALAIVSVGLPYIRNLLALPLELSFDPTLVLFLFTCAVAVVLLSGLYPAFVLSGFNPINALKAKMEAQSRRGISLRKGLVVLQFVIAQALIIGTLVVVKQMTFFRQASLGFDKEAVLTVPIPGDSASRTKIDFLKVRLLQDPRVKSVSFGLASPSDETNWYSDFKFDKAARPSGFGANLKWADADYLSTYNIPLVYGRNYHRSDTAGEVVVNEELVKQLGLTRPQEIIGKELDFWDGQVKARVVGVTKNFHATRLQEALVPVVIGNLKPVYRTANIKLALADAKGVIAFLERLWNSTFPAYVFEYRFLDQTIASFYEQEQQLAHLYKIFAAMAIFLSCLGLYGLASLMAIQKVKEVGIRKVLGASVQNIVYLFSREFILLVLIAFALAAPLAYYFMHQWLQDFAYRAPLSWWIFAGGGSIALVIALLTISYQAIKAALVNPVKNLRTE